MWKWLISNLKDIFSKEFWKRIGIICLVAIGAWVFFLIFGGGVADRVWGLFITASVFIITLSVLLSNTLYRKRTFWIIFIACFLAAFLLVRLLWK
jgi:hypothetical protein